MCFLDISAKWWKAVKGFKIAIVFVEFALWKLPNFGDKFWFKTKRSRVQARWVVKFYRNVPKLVAMTTFGAVLWTLALINLTELDKVGIVKSTDSLSLLQIGRYKLFSSLYIVRTQVKPVLYKIQYTIFLVRT